MHNLLTSNAGMRHDDHCLCTNVPAPISRPPRETAGGVASQTAGAKPNTMDSSAIARCVCGSFLTTS
jgi:hypothetical protein